MMVSAEEIDMEESFEIGKVCLAPGCEEGAAFALVTIKDVDGNRITVKLCAKHSETIAPELMRIYYSTRERWAEQRDKWSREAEARQRGDRKRNHFVCLRHKTRSPSEQAEDRSK